MRIKYLFWFLGLFLLISCSSAKFDGTAVLSGKIYDSLGNPVPAYHVSAGIGKNAVSDINGFFAIRDVPDSDLHIKGSGEGWASVDFDFDFHDRKQILCIQVESLESILCTVESLCDEERFDEAKAILKQHKSHNEKNPMYVSMVLMVEYLSNPTEKNKAAILAYLEKF